MSRSIATSFRPHVQDQGAADQTESNARGHECDQHCSREDQVTGITASRRKIAALLIGVLVGWSVQLSYGRNGGHVTLDVRLSATAVTWPKLAHRPSGSPTACADRCHSNAISLTNSI